MTSILLSKIDFRKYLKVLPVAAFVLTIGFYQLFSLFRNPDAEKPVSGKSGFNTDLPAPNLDNRYKNKLDLYMEAREDSLKRLREAQKDTLLFPTEHPVAISAGSIPELPGAGPSRTGGPDYNEQRVQKALGHLEAGLSRSGDAPVYDGMDMQNRPTATAPSAATADLAHFEKLLDASASNESESAELVRMDGMLDKILEIKEPGRRARRNAQPSDSSVAFRVVTTGEAAGDEQAGGAENGFYGISDGGSTVQDAPAPGGGTIAAVVHATQRVRTGSIVRFRLLQDIFINGTKIPANSFVWGSATVSKERVEVEIRHAVFADNVLPVNLTVFDTDGIAGISAPGADARETGREELDQAVQNLELYSMDPSIGAQAATSGIKAAKSLLSKKTKTPFATLKADHKVMLVNANM